MKDHDKIINVKLLNELVDLVYKPHILSCKFDQKFLEIPEEILIITMQHHQKYFHTFDQKGNINMNECFYCLDCQSLYYDDHKCPPLVIERKKSLAMKLKNSNIEESLA